MTDVSRGQEQGSHLMPHQLSFAYTALLLRHPLQQHALHCRTPSTVQHSALTVQSVQYRTSLTEALLCDVVAAGQLVEPSLAKVLPHKPHCIRLLLVVRQPCYAAGRVAAEGCQGLLRRHTQEGEHLRGSSTEEHSTAQRDTAQLRSV